jgi:hypothetical protein
VLVPGPPEEVEAIRWIFEDFARRKKEPAQLARILNDRGIPASDGQAWTSKAVRRVLRNERYIGNYVWNRFSAKLHTMPKRNAPEKWIRADGVIAPIVPKSLFDAAREILCKRKLKLTLEERLEPLRLLLRRHGRLTCNLIAKTRSVPSVSSYQRWFGGVIPAYRLVGYTHYRPYTPRQGSQRSHGANTTRLSDAQMLDLLRSVLKSYGYLNYRVISQTEGIPHANTYAKRFGGIQRVYRLAGFTGDVVLTGRPLSRPARHAATAVLSKAKMLAILRRLLQKHGKLTQKIIQTSRETPSVVTYAHRFGSIGQAYRLIGYEIGFQPRCWKTRRMSDAGLLEVLRKLLKEHGRLSLKIIDQSEDAPHSETYRRRFGSLRRAYALIGCGAS